RRKTAKPTTLLIGNDEGAAEPLAVCHAEDEGKSRRVEPLILADFSEVRVTNPSAEMGVGRFYGWGNFPENQPFVCGWAGRAL
ncbi:MAG: hypothetical protein RL077_4705, partial [Verrucomicrobiota bacterium]